MEQPSRLHFLSPIFLIGFGLGCFVGVMLAMLAVAIVQNSDASSKSPSAVAELATATSIAGASATPDARPRLKAAGDVFLGPGTAFATIGTISRGQAVEVVGRDADGVWAAIRFPPDSTGRGWVPLTQLDGITSLNTFSVLLPTPLPRSVSTPNSFFSSNDGGGAVFTNPPTATPLPIVSGTPATPGPNKGPVDLVVSSVSVLADGRVRVVVGNRGPGDFLGQQLFVTVRDHAAANELIVAQLPRLVVGATTAVETSSFRITRETDVDAIVDPFGNLTDADRANNTLTVTLSPLPGPTPTPAPPQ